MSSRARVDPYERGEQGSMTAGNHDDANSPLFPPDIPHVCSYTGTEAARPRRALATQRFFLWLPTPVGSSPCQGRALETREGWGQGGRPTHAPPQQGRMSGGRSKASCLAGRTQRVRQGPKPLKAERWPAPSLRLHLVDVHCPAFGSRVVELVAAHPRGAASLPWAPHHQRVPL